MSAPTIELAPQQAEAVSKIADWFTDPTRQVFRLFGYAGTGKTTLAQHLVDSLGVGARTLYAAYTGKAAYVLRTKGCPDASTIHSLIYQPVEKSRAELEELKARRRQLNTKPFDELTPAERDEAFYIARAQAKVDSPDWVLREETDLDQAALLVIDEVSMVGERIAHDLLSYGCKILCLGDPAQLPPVDGGGWFVNHAPDHLLTEIHRSALDSPVTRIATIIRASQPGQRDYGLRGGFYDADHDVSGRVEHLTIDQLLAYDQVLVGRNATRWQAVHLLRALRARHGQMPMAGDRIIALANSAEAEVFNGQQLDVLGAKLDPAREDRYRLHVRDDEGHERELTVWAAGFRDLEGERQAKRDGRGTVAAATFGQAITVHKSQGSQWPRVLVVDESSVFFNAAYRETVRTLGPGAATIEGHINGQRWLYTACTRASQAVVIVPGLTGLVTP